MAKAHIVAALVGILISLIGRTSGFLATKLNASDPDLEHILCPDQTTGITHDHKWITREAIRRNLRQFFIDFPPPDQPGFNVPESASLTELYHAYYGDEASPARFIKAVNTIAESNVYADSSKTLRYDPNIQADAEVFDEYQYSMSDRYPLIITSILVDEAYPAARTLLGVSLHSLQKFYAHSTWVEQGNSAIIDDLGLPGFPGFEDPAEPTEDVCTPCPSDQGECRDNVILGAGITTGYYTYEDEEGIPYLVPKPTTGGKCSHGGVLDGTADEPAIGGINKDTASPCFSPHYYLHDQAAELAVQATDHYLHVILDAVDVEKYRALFDLYHGSALSIVIDTTSSMGSEIDAVKEQVHQIVESSFAGSYILVPFNDPEVGPVTRTEDPEEFLAAVDILEPYGGGDLPEMFWGGLQLALTNTPEYGVIFCFTDAVGKDGDKMEGDIAMAQEKNTKVTIIFSGTIYDEKEPNRATDMDDYYNLCDITGGLFIESGKFDIGEITPLLNDVVESTEVDIVLLKGIDVTKDTEIPIDDSIFDFKIQVAGDASVITLTDPEGKEYNILDQAAMESDPDIELIVYTDTIRALRWHDPIFGIWNLRTESATKTLSLNVQGNSTLSWLGGFSLLDPSPPHPHYMSVEGRPLTETVYYIDIILIGYIESEAVDVDHIDYVNIKGDLLRTIDYTDEIDDEFYVRSEPLPEEPFYMMMYGHVSSGNVFCRLMSVLIIPVQASVEVTSTSEELSAKPGETAQGTFLVRNYGLESDFIITGNDDKSFMTSITPKVHISHNGSAEVIADFSVPSTATPGTVSIVTVTAASVKQTQSVNSAVTQFVVLPPEKDHEPPLCALQNEPSCGDFTYVGVCQNKNWTAVASLVDNGSGMNQVYAKPKGYSTEVDVFTAGSQDPVGVTHINSCCSLQVDIIGVDLVGNVGKCQINLGVLGGVILNLEAIDVGTSWVYLKWTLSPTVYDVHKYTLIVNDDYTFEFPCKESTCYYNATSLEPCALQNFQLTPVFTIETEDYRGGPAFTDATTLSTNPKAPIDGKVDEVSLNEATVSWTPVDNQCISLFQVCVKPIGFEDPEVCDTTSDSSYTITELEACAIYHVEVTPIDLVGHLSTQSLIIEVNTEEGLPGEPQNFQAEMIEPNTALLTWYDPLENPFCIETYAVTTDIIESNTVQVAVSNKKHTVIEENLRGCTNYTFKVYAISKAHLFGPYATQDALTEEGDPVPIDTLDLSGITTSSMDAQWASDDACLDHYRVCYYNDYDLDEICEDVDDTQKSLEGLLECVNYHVSVSTVSISGQVGEKTTEEGHTLDVAPSVPLNVNVSDVTAYSITVQYDEPESSPQCANTYSVDISKKSSVTSEKNLQAGSHTHHQVFEELDACTDYVIRISAASPSGLTSDWVSTEATTDATTPSEVRGLAVESITFTNINLKWFEPEDGGMCAYKYTVTWEGGSLTVGPPAPGEHLPHQVEALAEGLDKCTEYTFEVTSETSTGLVSPPATIVASTEC